jgi:hypothetical protein
MLEARILALQDACRQAAQERTARKDVYKQVWNGGQERAGLLSVFCRGFITFL